MPEMHLKQPAWLNKSGFTYNACGPFIKNKERDPKFKETGNSSCIYRNELDILVFNIIWLINFMVYEFLDKNPKAVIFKLN